MHDTNFELTALCVLIFKSQIRFVWTCKTNYCQGNIWFKQHLSLDIAQKRSDCKQTDPILSITEDFSVEVTFQRQTLKAWQCIIFICIDQWANIFELICASCALLAQRQATFYCLSIKAEPHFRPWHILWFDVTHEAAFLNSSVSCGVK